MFLSKHFALFLTAALFVASAGAADTRTNRLRGVRTEGEVERERALKSKSNDKNKTKSDSKSKSDVGAAAGGTDAEGNFLTDAVVVIKPQPITPKATLEDWVKGCSEAGQKIDNCTGQTTFISNPKNCKTCLKALGSLQNPPPAYGQGKDGITLCANGPAPPAECVTILNSENFTPLLSR